MMHHGHNTNINDNNGNTPNSRLTSPVPNSCPIPIVQIDGENVSQPQSSPVSLFPRSSSIQWPAPFTNLVLSKLVSASTTGLMDRGRLSTGPSKHDIIRNSVSEINLRQIPCQMMHNKNVAIDANRSEQVTPIVSYLNHKGRKCSIQYNEPFLPLEPTKLGCLDRLRNRLTFSPQSRQKWSRRLNHLMYYVRVFLTHLFSTTGLCFLVVIYSCLGALIFAFLESQNEIEARSNMKQERVRCALDLWNYTLTLNVLHPTLWKQVAIERIRSFEEKIIDAVQNDGYGSSVEQWSFSGALLYSVTVVTTIGYGNVTCKTDWGRIVTILYAIIGIPITFLCLANLGNLMAEAFRFGYRKICCCGCFFATKSCLVRDGKKIKLKKTKTKQTNRKDSGEKRNLLDTSIQPNGECSVMIQLNPLDHSKTDDEQNQPLTTLLTPAGNESMDSKCNNLRPTASHRGDKSTEVVDECKSPSLSLATMPNGKSSTRQSTAPPPTTELITNLLNLACGSGSEEEEEDTSDDEGRGTVKRKVKDDEDGERVPILLVFCLVIGYIILGAFMFSIWEEWGPIEGAYFCFTTLTTIGFGDLVPGSAKFSYHKDGQTKFIICCVYMMVGLSLIAMSFNLVQEEIVIKCRGIARRIGIMPNMATHAFKPARKYKAQHKTRTAHSTTLAVDDSRSDNL